MSIFSSIANLFGGKQPNSSQAQFKGYGVTTPFGTSAINSKTRQITANLSPELQDLFDQLIQGSSANMPTQADTAFGEQVAGQGAGIFGQYAQNLQDALNYDVNQSTTDYYNRALSTMQPDWTQEENALMDKLFASGRSGAGVAMDGGYVNPELYSLFKGREAAKMGLFLNAEDRARAIRDAKIQEATGGMTNAIGMFGTGRAIPSSLYGNSLGILSGAMNIPTSLGQQIGYGLQAGQAAAQAGANAASIDQANYNSNIGFWGGLLGGANYGSGGFSYGKKG